mmetsp:Transcript_9953/g.15134  ORF Transcript_9953/g.15134 Transcript_9953/m.15134 type:complete len:357 (-) Transcript_9953:28-1098(-)
MSWSSPWSLLTTVRLALSNPMGNRNCHHSSDIDRARRWSFGKKEKTKHLDPEAFFVEHHRAKQSEQATAPRTPILIPSSPDSPVTDAAFDYDLLCKRTVFVSLTGLHESWRDCPTVILYSSIFIFPLKKEWIYRSKTKQEVQQHRFSTLLQDAEFVRLLRWKDAQGLLFCMEDISITQVMQTCDHGDPDHDDVLIHPFWRYLSRKLSTMYDPATGHTYSPLRMDMRWWDSQYAAAANNNASQFNATVAEIQRELLCLDMKLKSISELLYQSNPTMNIVMKYGLSAVSSSSQLNVEDGARPTNGEADDADDNGSNVGSSARDSIFHDEDALWISNDYDDEEAEEPQSFHCADDDDDA